MLAYYASGNPENPMVVLMHGVCDSATCYVDVIRYLQDQYFVVALDGLGHGVSPRYTEDQLADPFAAAVAEVEATVEYLVKLYGKTPALVAHSMGGAIMSVLLGKRPDLFVGGVLEDPAWLSEEQYAGYIERGPEQVELSAGWRGKPVATISENAELRPDWEGVQHYGWAFGKGLVDPQLLASGVVTFSESWEEVASKIARPTVVVTSDTDEVLVGEAGVQQMLALCNANIIPEVIPGQNHAVRLGAPEEFEQIVKQHLSQLLS